MNLQKSLFLAGFGIIPAVLWFGEVHPARIHRTAALERQANAGRVVAAANKVIAEHEALKKKWAEFQPLEKKALEDLQDELNPLLIPGRAAILARSMHMKEFQCKQDASQDQENEIRFTLNGEGTFKDLVRFVDVLERGRQRARFDSLRISLPVAEYGMDNGGVTLSGTFLIPGIPELDLPREPEADQ
ncbi:MAG: hypothetical protein ACE5H3_02255 [Planctomycetota bacterium]